MLAWFVYASKTPKILAPSQSDRPTRYKNISEKCLNICLFLTDLFELIFNIKVSWQISLKSLQRFICDSVTDKQTE